MPIEISKSLTLLAPTAFYTEGGASSRVLGVVRGLNRIGTRTTVLTYPSGRDWPEVDVLRPRRSARVMGIGFNPIRSFYDVELMRLFLARELGPEEHVHAFLHEGGLMGMIRSRLSGSPFVLDIQGSFVEEVARTIPAVSRGATGSIARWMEASIERSASQVVVSSPGLFNVLTERGGISQDRIHLIPDGVAVEDFNPAYACSREERVKLRERLGVPQDSIIAIYVGAISPEQGIDDLIEASPKMVRAVPKLRIVIFGRPAQLHSGGEYERRVKRLGLEGKVLLKGPLQYEKVPPVLSGSDMALSWKKGPPEEGNGKIPIYMASGLPVLALRLPASEFYLGTSGEAGGVVADSVAQAADQLVALAGDPDRREALGRAGRAHAESDLSIEGMARKILEVHGRLG